MLFRNKEGNLVELNRYDYTNDHIYYKKIMKTKNLLKETTSKEGNYSNFLIQKSLFSRLEQTN